MNLHAIVAGVVGAVNPLVQLRIEVSTGSTISAGGKRVPTYAEPVDRMGQVQPLTTGNILHLNALNIQGAQQAIYIPGVVSGLVRQENKGGDLIVTADGRVWLVLAVLEQWPDWVKVAVVRQNEGREPLPGGC